MKLLKVVIGCCVGWVAIRMTAKLYWDWYWNMKTRSSE